MTRLIVDAEVVHAWDEALGSLESGAGRGIIVCEGQTLAAFEV